jgi:cyanophycinase
MRSIEAALLEGRPAKYVQIATAAVPDGPKVLQYWHDLGRKQAEALGAEQVVLNISNREDADDLENVAKIHGAGLIYLSGGNPAFLADTLRGTLVWEAITHEWENGAALAGCSAGAMVMSTSVPPISSRMASRGEVQGLNLLPHLRVIPHFDRFKNYVPDLETKVLENIDPSISLIGIDEDTALVGGPEHWTVQGLKSVWLLEASGSVEFKPGQSVQTPTT